MVSKNFPAKADPESGDLLTQKFRESMLRIESLRTENRRLMDQVGSPEIANLEPEIQVQSPKLSPSTAEEFREHAARCLKLADEANFAKLREVFLAEADGWLRLARQQEQREKRSPKTAMSLTS
jgi:hypothetical protein